MYSHDFIRARHEERLAGSLRAFAARPPGFRLRLARPSCPLSALAAWIVSTRRRPQLSR